MGEDVGETGRTREGGETVIRIYYVGGNLFSKTEGENHLIHLSN